MINLKKKTKSPNKKSKPSIEITFLTSILIGIALLLVCCIFSSEEKKDRQIDELAKIHRIEWLVNDSIYQMKEISASVYRGSDILDSLEMDDLNGSSLRKEANILDEDIKEVEENNVEFLKDLERMNNHANK